MTRTFDPRARYHYGKSAKSKTRAETKSPEGRTQYAYFGSSPRVIVGGQPVCKFCSSPATEIALPMGTPVCANHGDSRTA